MRAATQRLGHPMTGGHRPGARRLLSEWAGRAGAAFRPALAGCLALGAAGCGFIAKDGPTGLSVRTTASVTVRDTLGPVGYAVVELSPVALKIANELTVARNPTFTGLLSHPRNTDVRIGVGDIVSITIFEATSGGLFIPQEAGSRAGNFVQIPNEQVDNSGTITVPYAGAVKIAGLTSRQASEEISRLLSRRAIEPQVVVTMSERRGNDVSVLGDVNAPTRFSLDPGGIKLLGAMARAGGPKNPPYETVVTIQRGGRTTQSILSTIVRTPKQNVQLAPGDVVYVSREPKIFLALGATPSPGAIGGTNNRRFTFDNDNMTLSEAAAKAGGLDTTRADPRGVFLYRQETRTALAAMGVDVSRYSGDSVPTIYTADFSRGDTFFLANSLYLRDRDVIFVSEAPSADLEKFTTALSGITGNAASISALR